LQLGDIKGGMLEVRRAIDRDTNEVITPKHDKVRMVPLSPRLVDALEALPRRGLWAIAKLTGDRLGYYGILDPIKALYALAGVEKPPKPIHCLRHTFGSEAAAAGVPITTIKELMGHARIETTMRYITVNEAQLRDAIATMHDYSGSGSGAAARNEKRRR
jgi:integrase